MKYDYLVVGSGLYGAIFAHEARVHGKSVLVVDKRPNIAGNIYTENIEGINVHKYGAHIFHTNNKKVWNYITQFAEFNRFTNSPVAKYYDMDQVIAAVLEKCKKEWLYILHPIFITCIGMVAHKVGVYGIYVQLVMPSVRKRLCLWSRTKKALSIRR